MFGRKKALVYFSEGIDYDVYDPFQRDTTTLLDAQRDLIAAATRANVAIYGIDVRGLGAGADDAIEIQSFPDDPTLGLNSTALQNEVRLGQDMLRVVSDETGGFATVNNNDITGAMNRLVEENSSYYVLGYYAGNTRRDGRFRRLEVRVNQPGLTVSARKGYYAPRGRAPETTLAGPKDASAGTARGHEQSCASRGPAACDHRQRVQRTGQQGFRRHFHDDRRTRLALDRKGRRIPKRPRGGLYSRSIRKGSRSRASATR